MREIYSLENLKPVYLKAIAIDDGDETILNVYLTTNKQKFAQSTKFLVREDCLISGLYLSDQIWSAEITGNNTYLFSVHLSYLEKFTFLGEETLDVTLPLSATEFAELIDNEETTVETALGDVNLELMEPTAGVLKATAESERPKENIYRTVEFSSRAEIVVRAYLPAPSQLDCNKISVHETIVSAAITTYFNSVPLKQTYKFKVAIVANCAQSPLEIASRLAQAINTLRKEYNGDFQATCGISGYLPLTVKLNAKNEYQLVETASQRDNFITLTPWQFGTLVSEENVVFPVSTLIYKEKA